MYRPLDVVSWRHDGIVSNLPKSWRIVIRFCFRFIATTPSSERRPQARPIIYYLTGAARIAEWAQTQGKIPFGTFLRNALLGGGTVAPNSQEPHPAGKRLLRGELEAQVAAFTGHYNHQRYQESLNNVTPANVQFGRDKAILQQTEGIKRKTLETRRLHHRQLAAQSNQPDKPKILVGYAVLYTENSDDGHLPSSVSGPPQQHHPTIIMPQPEKDFT